MFLGILIALLIFSLPLAAENTNLALNKPYVFNLKPTEPYTDKGGELTDGQRAKASIGDQAWQGFSRGEYRIVVVDLGATYAINTIKLGSMKYESANVWFPGNMSVALSDDGINWRTVNDNYYGSKDLPHQALTKGELLVDTFNEKGRYVAVKFAVSFWVFVDELEIIGKDQPLGNESTESMLDEINFKDINTEMLKFFNKAVYDKAEGEFLLASEKTGGAKDILLVYDQATGIRWSEVYAYPYVAYLDEDLKPKAWFFDTFLFLGITTPSGRNFGAPPYADKFDWIWWLERVFEPGYGFDAYNRAITTAGEKLGDLDYKAKIIVMIPYPAEDRSHAFDKANPGYLDLYQVGREDAAQNRLSVVKWYLSEFEKRWENAVYDRLELIGYYWFSENLDQQGLDRVYLPEIGNLVREKGYRFFWIPWFLAPGYANWQELGFDAVMMQPNYMFVEQSAKSRLPKAAAEAKKYGLGLEYEADPSIFYNSEKRERFYDYFRTANTLGYGHNILRSYYQDVNLLGNAARHSDPEMRMIYDLTYEFVRGTFSETIKE